MIVEVWAVRLLGGLSARRGEDRVERFRSQKTAALFAFLCLHAPSGRQHGREELATLLWPDEDPERARANLRVALSYVRRALEPPGTPADAVLLANRTHVSVRRGAVRTDVEEFEAALKAGDAVRARALYDASGPLLPGVYEEWALLERERLEALADAAREDASPRPAAAPPTTLSPASPDPPDPPARVPYRLPLTGDRFFGREEEGERLEMLLTAGGANAARLVTVVGPGGAGKTRLAVETAHRLSAPDAEKDKAGPGGGAFTGGVWFVPLAALRDAAALPTELPPRLLAAMRLPADPRRDPFAQLAEAVGDRPALFVLDNLEQVVDAAPAALAAVLERLPTVRLLATSRVRTGVRGERVVPLGPLPVPDADEATVGALSRLPAARLFADRARAADTDFALTAGNAAEVAALLRLLDGFPLALELAAAWAGVLSPRQMREQLARRIDALPARHRRAPHDGDAADRHRSLGAAFDWSLDLLEPETRARSARLSVFRGGFTAEAAGAVCDAPLHALSRLHQHSLLESRPDAGNGGMRFTSPESLRALAEERLTDDEAAGLRERHAAHFLALASAERAKIGTPEAAAALDRMETERDNLLAALAWASAATDRAGTGETALRLAASLQWLWTTRGPVEQGRARLAATLALTHTGSPSEARADALNALGGIAYLQADAEEARARFTESLTLCRALGYPKGALVALSNLGTARMEAGEPAEARPLFEEALGAARTLGDAVREAVVLYNLGNLHHWLGDLDAARARHEEALHLRRPLGDARGISLSLTALGILALERNDADAARDLLRDALALQRDLGDRFRAVNTLEYLARADEQRGDLTEAVRRRGAADALRVASGTPLPPNRRAVWDEENAALRGRLGDAAFDAAWAEGAAQDFAAAAAAALR